MSDIKALLKQYEDVNAALNAEIKKNGEEFMKQVFKSIFEDHPGLNVIVVRGYTPGFNDGEPCEHSHDVYAGYVTHSRFSDASWLDFDDFDEMYEYFEYDEETGEHLNSGCSNSVLGQAASAVRVFDELIERVYHTDFDIVAKRFPGGSVEVTRDSYWVLICTLPGSLETRGIRAS